MNGSSILLAHELSHGLAAYLSGATARFTIEVGDVFASCSFDIPLNQFEPEPLLATALAGPLTSAVLEGADLEGLSTMHVIKLALAHQSAQSSSATDPSDLVLVVAALKLLGRDTEKMRRGVALASVVAGLIADKAQANPEIFLTMASGFDRGDFSAVVVDGDLLMRNLTTTEKTPFARIATFSTSG